MQSKLQPTSAPQLSIEERIKYSTFSNAFATCFLLSAPFVMLPAIVYLFITYPALGSLGMTIYYTSFALNSLLLVVQYTLVPLTIVFGYLYAWRGARPFWRVITTVVATAYLIQAFYIATSAASLN